MTNYYVLIIIYVRDDFTFHGTKMFVNGALCENGVIAETFQESNAFICLFEMN